MSPAETQHETAALSAELVRFRPRRAQRYTTVNVLLLTWQESDLDLVDEVNRLDCIFREKFNYRVWCYQIPHKNPKHDWILVSKISSKTTAGTMISSFWYTTVDMEVLRRRQSVSGPRKRHSTFSPYPRGSKADTVI
jgi:hypothetical protein